MKAQFSLDLPVRYIELDMKNGNAVCCGETMTIHSSAKPFTVVLSQSNGKMLVE